MKIFIFLFSISLFSDSISKSELRTLKKEIEENFKDKKYSIVIPKIEKIIIYSEESKYRLWLGLSYFNRDDLEIPSENDEIFLRNKKIQNLKTNYLNAEKFISEYILFLERRNLLKTELRIAEYYFILGTIAYLLNENKKSEFNFKKSLISGFPNKEIIKFNLTYLTQNY